MENNERNTMNNSNNSENTYIEEEITFRELGARLGINNLDEPEIYDIREQGYEILSFDHEANQETWKPLEAFVVKKNAPEHYQLNTLHGTLDHKVFYQGDYIRLADHPGAELVKAPIQVVDCQVADTHNYLAEGQINHNTTTPGGQAVPYTTSVRLRVMTGKPIFSEINKDKAIGLNVEVKIIKNKIANPSRSAELSIIFGHGVRDDDQMFDALRAFCDAKGYIKSDGKRLCIEGTSAHKTFSVVDDASGEILHEVKFFKKEFAEKVLKVPEYSQYIRELQDAALIMRDDDLDHPSFKGADVTGTPRKRGKAIEEEEKEDE